MKKNLLIPLLILLFLFLLDRKVFGEALFVDHLICGNEQSELSHAVEVQGNGAVELLKTVMGGLKGESPVRTLKGTGSKLEFQMDKGGYEGSFILEIQEIHDRRPQAHGYSLFVNGVELYFRTYQELGAGPNHYFVSVPADVAKKRKSMEVSLQSRGSAPFSIGQVWLYADFFKTVDAVESVYRPMGLNGKFKKPSPDEKPMSCFSPLGTMLLTNYQNKPFEKTRADILKSIDQADQAGAPVQIVINGATWGGAPKGPDGLGGYFCDSRYSQVSYDSQRKAYRPSWPNMWSSSIWSTFRDPYMNEQMRKRFFEVMRDVPEKIAFDQARGMRGEAIFVREMGPPLGEVTAATMAEAKKEGVILNYSDGLSSEEQAWVFQDGVCLWKGYAEETVKAVGRNYVIVDRGEVRLPTDPMTENLYAQTYFKTEGPMKDSRWFGGQSGMVKGLWSSGELFWTGYTYYDYLRANGKLAHVNLEATILKEDYTPLRNLYATGFQYVTLYNELETDTPFIRKADGFESMPMFAPEHYSPYFFEAPYRLRGSLGSPDEVISHRNIEVQSRVLDNADSQSCSRLSVTDLSQPGEVIYVVENGGEAFSSELVMELDGRISPGKENRIEVWVGDTAETMKKVSQLTEKELPCPDHWTHFMTSKNKCSLGKSMVGKKKCFVKLALHAKGATDATFLLSCQIGGEWEKKSGHLQGSPWTMKENRTLELWVQDRSVAKRLLQRYEEQGGDRDILSKAGELYAEARYRSVQNLLNGELSQVLPARYAIRSHGKLGKYPIEVRLADPNEVILATILKLNKNEFELELTPEKEFQKGELIVEVGDVAKTATVRETGQNRYALQIEPKSQGSRGFMERIQALFSKDPNQSEIDIKEGKAVVPFHAEKTGPVKPVLPRQFSARFLEGDRKKIRVDTQNLEWMNFEENMTLFLSASVKVTRQAEGEIKPGESSEWPQKEDRVMLDLNDQGEVVSIEALYGYAKGKIKAVDPVSVMPPYSNGAIELENGKRFEFDVNAVIDTVAMHGPYRNYESKMFIEAFKPGQEIEIDYSPYAEKGGKPRIIRIHQPWKVLLDQNYVEMSQVDDWKKSASTYQGVIVKPHKPEPNYLHKIVMNLLRPTEYFNPGFICYQVLSEQPLKTTVVEFTARAFEDSSSVEFWVSEDQKSWRRAGVFDNSWQNAYPQSIDSKVMRLPWQFLDLTPHVQGKSRFYLKAVLRVNSADERFCVGAIRVVTER